MKYLKPFKENLDKTEDDISDILLELKETGKIRYGFNDPHKNSKFVMIRTAKADEALYWDEISQTVIRIADYLDNKFCIARTKKHPNYRNDRNLSYDTELEYIDIDPYTFNPDYGLWSVVIKWN